MIHQLCRTKREVKVLPYFWVRAHWLAEVQAFLKLSDRLVHVTSESVVNQLDLDKEEKNGRTGSQYSGLWTVLK